MSVLAWLLVVWFGSLAFAGILLIGKPRDPWTPRDAMQQAVIRGLEVAAIIVIAHGR